TSRKKYSSGFPSSQSRRACSSHSLPALTATSTALRASDSLKISRNRRDENSVAPMLTLSRGKSTDDISRAQIQGRQLFANHSRAPSANSSARPSSEWFRG